MNKTLRVAFVAAETGFDPQAISDLYSGYVTRVIFDPLYRYDYLARPFRIVPNTAAAMPEISADGRTWTIKVRPGIHFADDPAFKGRKRELTAADYVYSWKRLLDPKVRAPNIEAMTDRFVGDDAVLAAAKAAGKLDYDTAVRRRPRARSPHDPAEAQVPRLRPAGRSRELRDGGGRAGSRRDLRRCRQSRHGESGGHRPLSAEGVAARAEDRPGSEPVLSRGVLPATAATPPTRRSWP